MKNLLIVMILLLSGCATTSGVYDNKGNKLIYFPGEEQAPRLGVHQYWQNRLEYNPINMCVA